MSIGSVRQGTVSQDIKNLAAALMARDRQPIQLLQLRKSALTQRSGVLGALKTRLTALQSAADTLGQTGTLSPFAAKSTTSSQNALISAAATSGAATGAMSIAVQQLARRATHVSDLFTDTSTAISGAGAGTFAFTVTVGATNYDVSVTVAAGEDDKTVLDNIATAVATAVGSKGSAMRIQTEAGKSRLSLASADTGTANKLTFTDTGGLLARIGLYKASPTQATDTTGGYVYEDLGGHQLDAKLLVDGLTYYRASNTISDLINGVTLTLKGVTTTNADVRVQADGDAMVGRLKEFVSKYNDVLDYLAQNTFVDPKAGTRGVLALEPVYGDLAGQLRIRLASRVTSQAAGKPDTLSALGIKPGPDGKLSIVNETALRDTLAADPAAAATLFSAADGLATLLEPYIQSFSKTAGQIAASQNQITLRVSSLDKQIGRMEALVSKRQANLEEQLARNQAIIQGLQRQQQFVQQILGAGL